MSQALILLIIRICTSLTFFILAAGGPYALYKLSRFIKSYTIRHQELTERVAILERILVQKGELPANPPNPLVHPLPPAPPPPPEQSPSSGGQGGVS